MRRLLVTFFGVGYGPVASGTYGSLAAAAVFAALWFTTGPAWWGLVIMIAAASVVNVVLGNWAVKHFGSHDPGEVVIDEVAGMWLSLLLVPMTDYPWLVLISAFFLFRFFDIAKFPPAKQLERLPGGWGILCDDLAAGIQTNIVLQVVFRFLVVS